MKGYVADIEQATLENTNFRRVLYTGKHSQLVVTSIPPGEEIGEETHHLDQFLRIEQGTAKAILNEVVLGTSGYDDCPIVFDVNHIQVKSGLNARDDSHCEHLCSFFY